MRVLITGGAGFIGTALARRLLLDGFEITILDNFSEQIHGNNNQLAPDLRGHVRLVVGDVRDDSAWASVLPGQELVVHLAAETGTGQSMYQIRHYMDVNVGGTSALIQMLVTGKYRVRTLVVASSRAVYGEGAYCCPTHETVYPGARVTADLKQGIFQPRCPYCALRCSMSPTPEDAPLRPASLYGLTKQTQEQLILMYAQVLGCNGFALRFQNVFGPGQSLKNPYTGILAVFSNQARISGPIYVFEDGEESRDFVYIDDVINAIVHSLKSDPSPPVALNVGTGEATSVLNVACMIREYFKSASTIKVTGAFREGDVRHNVADLSKVRSVLGFTPEWSFAEGIKEFLNWSIEHQPVIGRYEQSLAEMREKGLMHG